MYRKGSSVVQCSFGDSTLGLELEFELELELIPKG